MRILPLYSLGLLRLRGRCRSQLLRIFPDDRRFAVAVAQIAGALIVANIAMMAALEHVSVALFQTTKAGSPVFTVAATVLLFGQSYSAATYSSLVPLVAGFYLAASSTHAAEISGLGVAGCVVSTAAQVFVNLRSKRIYATDYSYADRKGGKGRRVQAMELQFAISVFAAVFSLALPVATAAFDALLREHTTETPETETAAAVEAPLLLLAVVGANGALYFTESICAYSCNDRMAPLPFAILDSVRRLSIVSSSWILYGRHPTSQNLLGVVLVLGGALLYVLSIRKPVAKGKEDKKKDK